MSLRDTFTSPRIMRPLLVVFTLAAVIQCAGIQLRWRAMASSIIPVKAESVAKREGFGVQCKIDKRHEDALASGPGQLWGRVGGAWTRLPHYQQTASKIDVVERLEYAWRPQGKFVWLGGRKASPFQDATEYEIALYPSWLTFTCHLAASAGLLLLALPALRRMVNQSELPGRFVSWLETS